MWGMDRKVTRRLCRPNQAHKRLAFKHSILALFEIVKQTSTQTYSDVSRDKRQVNKVGVF